MVRVVFCPVFLCTERLDHVFLCAIGERAAPAYNGSCGAPSRKARFDAAALDVSRARRARRAARVQGGQGGLCDGFFGSVVLLPGDDSRSVVAFLAEGRDGRGHRPTSPPAGGVIELVLSLLIF